MRGRLLLGAITAVMLMAVALSGGRSPAVGQAKPAVKKLDLGTSLPRRSRAGSPSSGCARS